MYKKIKNHPSVKQIYSTKLLSEDIVTEEFIEKNDKKIYDHLDKSLERGKSINEVFIPDRPLAYSVKELNKVKAKKGTHISESELTKIIESLTTFPESFDLNPKLRKIIMKRKNVLNNSEGIDWAFAEALAFGALLLEGFSVRLSGQDSARGTFSQRHLILTDMTTGKEIIPLNSLSKETKIEPLDSLLSESAVMGFDYGYSTADPLTLVMWEAQFGDFANGAQVIIDNFISSSFTKWNQPSNLVLLLPHGQEGQGPEHSSARLERFLTLCAQENMIVANPTTPAQYFHILRKQVLGRIDIPLVLFTPKSLLRLPEAKSSKEEITNGKFLTIIDDDISKKDFVKKIILTSGKVYYDLEKYRTKYNIENTAIVRIEQYYPFDVSLLVKLVKKYGNASSISWVQEEPINMGAWSFMNNILSEILPNNLKLSYVGRKESPSPASGSTKEFNKTQEDLVRNAFGIT